MSTDTASIPPTPVVVAVPAGRPRRVTRRVVAPQGFEGEGFPVRRAFAGVTKAELDPFIHMDQMGEVEYAPGEPKGTPWHPHRGFETFTYLLAGEFIHQDSHGGGGTIEAGGTQYMTAGEGILHIETPPEHLVRSGGLFHGVQLWINLPRALKRIAPQYQDLQGHDSVLLTSPDGGAIVRVLAGSIADHAGPGISHTPLAIAHVTVAPGASIELPWPSEWNALAYVLAGRGEIGDAPVQTGVLTVLADGDNVRITGAAVQDGNAPSLEVFLLGGTPLREPVVQYGPFVMNTQAEIQEAFADYQSGRLGRVPYGAIQPFRA